MSDPRCALITGASRGLGYELCQVYLRSGWVVFPILRAEHQAKRFEAAPEGRCHPVLADLASDEATEEIRARVSARTGHLDVLVNNAGMPGAATELATLAPREIAELVNVHCLAAVRCARAALPLLEAREGSKLVNVSSRVGSFSRNAGGQLDEPVSYSYRIAKAAQNMLTVCMSQELGPLGVTVCAVHPGEFRSDLNPEGDESAAVAAERIVGWLEDVGRAHHGLWHDPRQGSIPW